MAQTLKFGNGTWATKKGSTLAFNDEDGNYKPLPFATTRATSATRVNKEGLIEVVEGDRPRIDYTDSAKGALLLEPQRTNAITYSENLNGTGWNVYGANGGTCARTLNYGISPSGKQDSTRVVFSEALVALYMSTNITGDASATMYVKGVSGEVIGFGYGASVSSGSEFTFNGEWQRLEYNGTSANSILSINTWSTTRTARDFEIYGVQMEEGSYPTSYIPTQGASATRLADTASGSGNSEVFNDSEGVLMLEISRLNEAQVSSDIISINDGSLANYITLYYDSSGVTYTIFGSTERSGNFSMSSENQSNFNKIALKYKTQNISLFVNGFEVDTNSGTLGLSGLNSLEFNHGNDAFDFYGSTKQIQYYNTVLTDAELETLTSYSSLSELVTELNLNTL